MSKNVINILRSNACKIAKRLADEKGGPPSKHMKEGWRLAKLQYEKQMEEQIRREEAEAEVVTAAKKIVLDLTK